MIKKPIWNSAIIGLGQIGMGYDYPLKGDSHILTHATGYYYHPNFKLVAGLDSDPIKRKLFENKFHVPAFQAVKDLYKEVEPEVLSIAVPIECQFKIFQSVIPYKPRAILCEKPISFNVLEAQKMIEIARNNEIILGVNYIRRFDPGINKLKTWIRAGGLGQVYKAHIFYSKGLLNNASHFIDLLIFFFEDVEDIQLMEKGRLWAGRDPEPDFFLKFKNGLLAYFLALKEEYFSFLETEIIGTKGRVLLARGGFHIELWKPQPDPYFPGDVTLRKTKTFFTPDMNRYQYNVFEHLKHSLINQKDLVSSGETALKTLLVMDQISHLNN